MKVIKENGITSLDLHGVSHQEAKIEVIDFAFRFQEELPLKVICGNSSIMINLAKNALEENNISYDSPRYGILRIHSFN
mgnify:CR=1 FL=1|jgi:hypothetical protein